MQELGAFSDFPDIFYRHQNAAAFKFCHTLTSLSNYLVST